MNNKSKNILQGKTLEKDNEGRFIINMNVKDDSSFLSIFSKNENPIISEEVANFIENSSLSIPLKQPITLRIQSNCIDDNEKETYKKAIKEYYTQKYIANEQEVKRNRLIVIGLTILGIIVLAFEIFFEYTFNNIIWSEVIDIFAWVLLWEAVDIGFFGSRTSRIKKLRYLSYLSMNIEYYNN